MKKILSLLFLVALFFGVSSHTSAAEITVQKGDTMWNIAKRYNVSFAHVLRLNKHFTNPNLIHPNDKVIIPDGSTGTLTNQDSSKDEIANGNSNPPKTETTEFAEAVVKLVNEERSKRGLNELELSSNLSDVATEKSRDMAVNNYFSHTSPTYGTPFQMLQKFGIHYMSAGENIAAGQQTPQAVMESWMNSSGHRENILRESFDAIGVGFYKGGSYGIYWTQLFIGN